MRVTTNCHSSIFHLHFSLIIFDSLTSNQDRNKLFSGSSFVQKLSPVPRTFQTEIWLSGFCHWNKVGKMKADDALELNCQTWRPDELTLGIATAGAFRGIACHRIQMHQKSKHQGTPAQLLLTDKSAAVSSCLFYVFIPLFSKWSHRLYTK